MLTTVLIVLHVLVALAIIGLVLLQHGKGADMGSGFGGGASGSLFGATGSANFLSRTTAVLAALFFILSLTPCPFTHFSQISNTLFHQVLCGVVMNLFCGIGLFIEDQNELMLTGRVLRAL